MASNLSYRWFAGKRVKPTQGDVPFSRFVRENLDLNPKIHLVDITGMQCLEVPARFVVNAKCFFDSDPGPYIVCMPIISENDMVRIEGGAFWILFTIRSPLP